MSRKDLARTFARAAKLSNAMAQDRVDTVVYKILKNLRSGKSVALPGVGKLIVERRGKS